MVLKGHCHELDSAANDTAEFFEHANISEKSKLYTNIHQHIKKGASWVLIWTKMGEKSRDTVPLRTAFIVLLFYYLSRSQSTERMMETDSEGSPTVSNTITIVTRPAYRGSTASQRYVEKIKLKIKKENEDQR